MKEQISFQADAAIIARLGRELVAKQETALIELVKNGFDADATMVDVVLEGDGENAALEVRDNGSGMTRQEVIDGFLRLASDLKVQSPVSPRYKRQRSGRKGIGRFATQRLGDRLILTTSTNPSTSSHRLIVDWEKFVGGRRLDEITVELEDLGAGAPGTVVRIERLRDEWSESQIRRCWRGLLSLQQPFPVATVENRDDADPGFVVRFLKSDRIFSDEFVVADMQTEILNYLPAVIEMKVDNNGYAFWKFSKNTFGEPNDWSPINHAVRDSNEPPPYTHLRTVAMKAYYVILDPQLLPNLVFTRIRDVLAEDGGIRLYRNGFRVIPYGDPGNDWLRLDETYARRQLLVPIANRNFFGVIEIHDSEGVLFDEHTSREGLIETPAFSELRDLSSSVLITAATQIAEERGRKTYAGRSWDRPTPVRLDFRDISAVARAAKEAAERTARETPTADADAALEHATKTLELLTEKERSVQAAEAQLANEMAMLRFLATLGMTTAEFSHETGMTFDAFKFDFEAALKVAIEAKANDPAFSAQAERAQTMLERLDALTSYLNGLAAARAIRGMRPISLSKAVEDFADGLRLHARSQDIELEVDTPAYDGLFTNPMHEAEVASILLNLHTNAIKAMKRSNNRRRILLQADRVDEPLSRVRIRFSDTGDGIPIANRDRIFEPFFTTRVAPAAGAADSEHASGTGLGLWIVKQIVSNSDGEVAVIEPPAGFSTCLEVLLPAEEDDGA